jgi:hypothetical protein
MFNKNKISDGGIEDAYGCCPLAFEEEGKR